MVPEECLEEGRNQNIMIMMFDDAVAKLVEALKETGGKPPEELKLSMVR